MSCRFTILNQLGHPVAEFNSDVAGPNDVVDGALAEGMVCDVDELPFVTRALPRRRRGKSAGDQAGRSGDGRSLRRRGGHAPGEAYSDGPAGGRHRAASPLDTPCGLTGVLLRLPLR